MFYRVLLGCAQPAGPQSASVLRAMPPLPPPPPFPRNTSQVHRATLSTPCRPQAYESVVSSLGAATAAGAGRDGMPDFERLSATTQAPVGRPPEQMGLSGRSGGWETCPSRRRGLVGRAWEGCRGAVPSGQCPWPVAQRPLGNAAGEWGVSMEPCISGGSRAGNSSPEMCASKVRYGCRCRRPIDVVARANRRHITRGRSV